MNVRKKISKTLILLILTTIFSTTFFNPKPAFAISTGDLPYLGQISLFAFDYAPNGWAECSGQIVPIAQNTALFSLIGTKFGGNGSTTYALPNLQNASPFPNAKYYIAMQGIFPSNGGAIYGTIGAVSMFPYSFVPGGWALCDGSTLNIAQNTSLYSLIGTSYGGDSTNFKVPNLSNVAPIANMNYYICVNGIYPSVSIYGEDFIGNVNLLAFTMNSTPDDASKATVQTLLISEYEVLFTLMGTNYGGDGINTFGIPDLRGATPSPQMQYYVTTQGYFPPHS